MLHTNIAFLNRYILFYINIYLTVVLPPASVAGITGGSLNFSAAAT